MKSAFELHLGLVVGLLKGLILFTRCFLFGLPIILDFFEPLVNLIKALPITDIIDQDDGIDAFVK